MSLSGQNPRVHPPQQSHQVRRNGLPKREALRELRWLEDGLDALSIDVVGTVARDRVGHEVRRELDHPGPAVVASLFIEVDGEPVGRLEQCGYYETHGPCAEDVHSDRGGQRFGAWETGLQGHSRPRLTPQTAAAWMYLPLPTGRRILKSVRFRLPSLCDAGFVSNSPEPQRRRPPRRSTRCRRRDYLKGSAPCSLSFVSSPSTHFWNSSVLRTVTKPRIR